MKSKKNIFFVIILVSSFFKGMACEYDNLTDNKKASLRKELAQDGPNEGVRISWLGVKGYNTRFGPDQVDNAISKFEKAFISHCDSLSSIDKQQIKLYKSDFKGHYIICDPQSVKCQNMVMDIIDKMPPTYIADNVEFKKSAIKAYNYSTGYIQARIQSVYPDFDSSKHNLAEFIDQKLRDGFKSAFAQEIHQIDTPLRDTNIKTLSANLALYRAGLEDQMNPDFKELAKILDNGLETPYTGSNNLDEELAKALMSDHSQGVSISYAKSGDDFYAVIKQDGKVQKALAGDIKGLGVSNMINRLRQSMAFYQHNESLGDIGQLLTISQQASSNADKQMIQSMDEFRSVLEKVLQESEITTTEQLDDALTKANELYYQKTLTPNSPFMKIRTALIDGCGKAKNCVMQNASKLHDLLKKMEAKGIMNYVGDSCLGLHYWLRVLDVK